MPNNCLKVYKFQCPLYTEALALLPFACLGVVVVAWRKPEVLLLLLCASPRVSAQCGLKQLQQEKGTQRENDEIWCCH
ncbi:hypothetical protein TNCV_990981 [Trichonephila clavipes]|nr:hypothetical protein TNCV_990981 [Trichonephila clavipes]